MAEGQVKQVLKKEVTCPLCLDLFKEPKKLPCDHVYCKECLRDILDAAISCPECSTLTLVPDKDINNFPNAFHVNSLIRTFKNVQVQQDMDSPSITEVCQAHPTQPLAIYCETCKKQLCRDCILMTKEHTNHEYGFFKETVSKYHKKFASEISLIKTQDSSISSALREIAIAERDVTDHAQKCQNDVEQAFEEMISVLQTCKQAMKDEATAYYSSLTGVFDQQKEQLRDIQSKIKLVVASVDTTLQDDDLQSFLERAESTFERISNLQKGFQTISLTVAKPQLVMKAIGADALQKYMKSEWFLSKPADAKMCPVDTSSLKFLVGEQTLLTLTLHDSSGNISLGENKVDVMLVPLQDNLIQGKVHVELHSDQGGIEIFLTPESRGQHQLNMKVNGAHIKDSPFTVTVCMPPKLLSQPVATVSGLKRPASLLYSEIEDTVFATIMGDDRIINLKMDTQFHVTQCEFTQLHKVHEITYDAALNVFYATTLDNQLHKLSSDGRIIKQIGLLGDKKCRIQLPKWS